MTTRIALLVTVVCMFSGCWNGGSTEINLGNVSIGQQMMDLKTALEAGAMSQGEYDETKQTLLSLNAICKAIDEDD